LNEGILFRPTHGIRRLVQIENCICKRCTAGIIKHAYMPRIVHDTIIELSMPISKPFELLDKSTDLEYLTLPWHHQHHRSSFIIIISIIIIIVVVILIAAIITIVIIIIIIIIINIIILGKLHARDYAPTGE